MVPKVVKSGVNAHSLQGDASSGNIKRQLFGYDSLDDALGSLSDLGTTIYGAVKPANVKPAAPAKPASADGWQRWALIGGGALAVIAILYFALRRK